MNNAIILIEDAIDGYRLPVYTLKKTGGDFAKLAAVSKIVYMRACANVTNCYRYLEMQFNRDFTNMEMVNRSSYSGNLNEMINLINRVLDQPTYQYGSKIRVYDAVHEQQIWSIFDGDNADF